LATSPSQPETGITGSAVLIRAVAAVLHLSNSPIKSILKVIKCHSGGLKPRFLAKLMAKLLTETMTETHVTPRGPDLANGYISSSIMNLIHDVDGGGRDESEGLEGEKLRAVDETLFSVRIYRPGHPIPTLIHDKLQHN
jgi:hypothetical protein